ncbi:hypothetical protein ACP275_12G122400 [Erythranthe tilingii]
MASTKTTVCLSLALLATAFVLSAAAAADSFCETADDKTLCAQLTKGGKTWAEAMTNALNGVMDRAKTGKAIADGVGATLPADLYPQSKQSIEDTCHEAYENMIDGIKKSIGFVKSDPYSSLKTYISSTTFSDCTGGLEEFGVNLQQVDDFANEIGKLSGTLLAVAQKKA